MILRTYLASHLGSFNWCHGEGKGGVCGRDREGVDDFLWGILVEWLVELGRERFDQKVIVVGHVSL